MLTTWLSYREQCVLARFQHALDAINARAHIIEGLITIYDHLDEVIEIIRNDDHPHQTLQQRFKISEIQATIF